MYKINRALQGRLGIRILPSRGESILIEILPALEDKNKIRISA